MADCVDVFLTENQTTVQEGEDLYLGFTFSFPVEQRALASGELLTWTKGFSAKNAVGYDVGRLLQDAFDRRHMHVKCVAIVNDVCLAACLRIAGTESNRIDGRHAPDTRI